MQMPQILVIGETGHGKDEVCKILEDHYGYAFTPASLFACQLFIFDDLKDKYKYETVEDCFNDRRNHIPEWVEAIDKFNETNAANLCNAVMATSDIYCGIRKRREFEAAVEAKLFDFIIFVDASERLGPPEEAFVELKASDADFVISNNDTIPQLIQRVKRAHAAANQAMLAKPVTANSETPAVFTRQDLQAAAQADLFDVEPSKEPEVTPEPEVEPGPEVEPESEVTPEPKAAPKSEVKPKPKRVYSRPPKAPARKAQ